MIDRERRDLYAERLRHFAAGNTTVDDYEALTEELACDSDDIGLYRIWENVWTLYDDFRTERMRGEWKLEGKRRQSVALCILFLYSDAEYEWPELNTGGCLLNLLTLGWQERRERKRWQQQLEASGDLDLWPFLRHEDLEAAKRTPKFFRAHD